ncbi:hypothetical protein Tco_0666076 [Tanacetum coccineum]
MESVKKSIGERAQHKMEYERRVNERLMQTTEEKDDSSKEPMAEVQTTAEINIFATGQQHTEQPEFNNEGKVDQNAEQCHDIRPLPAKLTDDKTIELSDQSLESENVCLKKIVAQYSLKYSSSLGLHGNDVCSHQFRPCSSSNDFLIITVTEPRENSQTTAMNRSSSTVGFQNCSLYSQDKLHHDRVGLTIPPSIASAEDKQSDTLSNITNDEWNPSSSHHQTALRSNGGVNTPGSDENSLKLYDLIADMKGC